SNEPPVAGATVEMIVRIEDHVLRTVDHAGCENLGAGELWRGLARHEPSGAGGFVKPEVDRIDIGGRQQPVLVLPELRVDRQNDDENGAHRELNEVAAEARVQERVVENVNRGEADHHRDSRTATWHESAEAHDQSGEGE